MAIRPEQHYTNAKGAAAYLGYSTKHFVAIAAKFQLPRYGHLNNRFKFSDLDLFMENPTIFAAPVPINNRRTKRKNTNYNIV